MLNYLFRVAVFLQLSYLYDLKFKRIFGVFVLWSSKYMNLVVQFSMSCAFRCIASRLAACLLYHFVFCLSRGFSNFFQVFFAPFLRNLAFSLASLRLAGCSLAAPIVYHILPRLSSGFPKFFRDFSNFFPIRVPVFLPFFSFSSVTHIIAAANCSSPIHRRSRSQHSIYAIYKEATQLFFHAHTPFSFVSRAKQ